MEPLGSVKSGAGRGISGTGAKGPVYESMGSGIGDFGVMSTGEIMLGYMK